MSVRLIDQQGVIHPKQETSKRWYIEYTEDGNRKRCYQINRYDTVNERYTYARKKMREIREQLAYSDKTPIDRALGNILNLKKPQVKQRTFYSYSSSVEEFIAFIAKNNIRTLPQFKETHAIAYRDELLLAEKAPKTINNYISFLRSLFNDMKERNMIETNPFAKLKKLKVRLTSKNQAFTRNEIALLKPYIEQDAQLNLAVKLMYFCFIRPAEILQLKAGDIDWRCNSIRISSDIAKNGSSQRVIIPLAFRTELSNIVSEKRAHELLIDNGGKSLSRNVLSTRHRKILKKLGLSDAYTFYSWKHTGVVEAYNSGIDIKLLQLQCRHHSLEMTDIYLKTLGLRHDSANFNLMLGL